MRSAAGAQHLRLAGVHLVSPSQKLDGSLMWDPLTLNPQFSPQASPRRYCNGSYGPFPPSAAHNAASCNTSALQSPGQMAWSTGNSPQRRWRVDNQVGRVSASRGAQVGWWVRWQVGGSFGLLLVLVLQGVQYGDSRQTDACCGTLWANKQASPPPAPPIEPRVYQEK